MSLLLDPGVRTMWAGDTLIMLRGDGGAWLYVACSSVRGKPVYRWHYA